MRLDHPCSRRNNQDIHQRIRGLTPCIPWKYSHRGHILFCKNDLARLQRILNYSLDAANRRGLLVIYALKQILSVIEVHKTALPEGLVVKGSMCVTCFTVCAPHCSAWTQIAEAKRSTRHCRVRMSFIRTRSILK